MNKFNYDEERNFFNLVCVLYKFKILSIIDTNNLLDRGHEKFITNYVRSLKNMV